MEWPSVAKQLSECLGVTRKTNKAMDVTVDLTFASWDGTVGAHAVEHFNAERWVGVRRDARKVEDIFSSASASSASAGTDLVYLSPDAEDVLEDVDADTVYVIGGIVDLAARGTATSLPRARGRDADGAAADSRAPASVHVANLKHRHRAESSVREVRGEGVDGRARGGAAGAAAGRAPGAV